MTSIRSAEMPHTGTDDAELLPVEVEFVAASNDER